MLIDGRLWLTTTEFAERLGVTPGRVRQFLLARRITFQKIGRDNLIPASELKKLANRQPGRPPSRFTRAERRRKKLGIKAPRSTFDLPIRRDLG